MSLAGTSRCFWVSAQPVERAPVHMSDQGRQKVRVVVRERQSGKGIYRKMGLRRTFSCKEPCQDQVSLSQFFWLRLSHRVWMEAEAGPPRPGWRARLWDALPSPLALHSSHCWLPEKSKATSQITCKCDLLGGARRQAGWVGGGFGGL